MEFKKHESKWSLLSFLFLSFQFIYLVSSNNLTKGSLDLKPKGTIKTIEVENGEIIDCVDIYKQPAFNHPLIKDLQMEPDHYPFGKNLDSNSTLKMLQDWHKYGECPEGTIPIRRSTSDVQDDHHYYKKHSLMRRQQINQSYSEDSNFESAIVGVQGNGRPFYGASGVFNIWNPKVEENELSFSKMWIITTYEEGDSIKFNSIEVGWAIIPRVYGDKQTRLNIHWTTDGYNSKGCYDLRCEGFVQTNKDHALGMPLKPISTYGGDSMVTKLSVFKDKAGDKWWLQVRDWIIGYWPTAIFPDLKNNADIVEWGGEIFNERGYGHHTTTQMGNGEFPDKGFRKSCYIHSLKVLDDGFVSRDPENIIKKVRYPTCYDLTLTQSKSNYETYIFFGGPGYSPMCP